MAARRGKSQARRSGGSNGGLPGWAWLVLGVVITLAAVIFLPKYLKSEGGDGFFRPQPNPDAQPAPVSVSDDDSVVPDRIDGDKPAKADGKKDEGYDFYDLLPGKEVPMTDAELAATERAETQREAARQKQAQADAATATPAATANTAPLPKPIDTGSDAAPAPSAPAQVASTTPVATTATTPAAATPQTASTAPATDGARYLLQAGAFQASGQAEELKAKIALIGLGARVESAQIKGKTVYRVRMGPYGTAGELAEAKRKLASNGLPGIAVKVK